MSLSQDGFAGLQRLPLSLSFFSLSLKQCSVLLCLYAVMQRVKEKQTAQTQSSCRTKKVFRACYLLLGSLNAEAISKCWCVLGNEVYFNFVNNCLSIYLSSFFSVVLLFYRLLFLLFVCSFVCSLYLLFCRLYILSLFWFIICSFNHLIVLSFVHSVICSFYN